MWEKIVPFWRDLSLHIYGTTQERLGFNASNIILGEIPLTPPKKRVENFNLLSSKQYIFSYLFQSIIYTLNMSQWNEILYQYCNAKLADFETQWLVWKKNYLYIFPFVHRLTYMSICIQTSLYKSV